MLEPVVEKLERLGEQLQRVGEQLEHVVRAPLHPTARPSFDQAETSQRRGMQLVFVNKLPSPIFTDSIIKAEDDGPVRIQLMDTKKGIVVETGPYSSIKIEIVVLNGEFCSDDHQDWSETEFRANIIREREGKRPLVTGELNVTLKKGVGDLGNIVFTDNSSWMRGRKFGLGARVLRSSDDDLRIREGRSEAFVVKDHRGKLNEKHHPPTLADDIWRLEKIAKDGKYHVRLTNNGVHTVRDFLRLYTANPTLLRATLKCQTKTWDKIIEHATSVIDDSLDELTTNQKYLAENQKKHAHKNVENLVPIDASTILSPSRPLTDLQAEPISGPTSNLQHPELCVPQPETQLDFIHASASTSYASYEDTNQFQLSSALNTPIQLFYAPENSWSAGCSPGQMSTWSPLIGIGGQDFLPASNDYDSGLGNVFSVPNLSVHISSTGKPKATRCKILAAIFCVLFWRNITRRMARPFYLCHK